MVYSIATKAYVYNQFIFALFSFMDENDCVVCEPNNNQENFRGFTSSKAVTMHCRNLKGLNSYGATLCNSTCHDIEDPTSPLENTKTVLVYRRHNELIPELPVACICQPTNNQCKSNATDRKQNGKSKHNRRKSKN